VLLYLKTKTLFSEWRFSRSDSNYGSCSSIVTCVYSGSLCIVCTWPVARIEQQGGVKNQKKGPNTRRGPHFKNTVLDVCSNQGAKREMGGHRFQMEGQAPLAPPLAMALVCTTMGVGRIFSRGFNTGEMSCYQLETKRKIFFY